MRTILLLTFLVALSASLFGQTLGEIAGEVKDAPGASVPSASVTNPAKPGPSFLSITSTANAMRQMQFALKLIF